MCGRFTQTHSGQALAKAFGLSVAPDIPPRYNIAPSQSILVVRAGESGREVIAMRWGLIPSWMKEPPKDARLINARADTVAVKPSFRAAFKRRRCLIPADGFYEWQKLGDRKQPYYIRYRDHHVFAFAGLWEHWEREGGAVQSCTIITTDANALMRPIHERMPVILDPKDYGPWLGEVDVAPIKLGAMLAPPPDAKMETFPIRKLVNSPRNDTPECIVPDR